MAPKVEQLPEVHQFDGMYFDPQTNMITLGYIPAHKSDTVYQLKFPLEASSNLTAWLVEMLEKLTGNVEMGQRLQALKFRGDKPQGKA